MWLPQHKTGEKKNIKVKNKKINSEKLKEAAVPDD